VTQQTAEQSFGQLLQRARLEKKHLTLRDLARSANVSEAVYRSWEADQGHPNRLQLTKMLGSGHWLHPYLPKKAPAVVPEAAPLVIAIEPRSADNVTALTFGGALQAERKREGLDQDTLGALLDPPVTGQAVSAWETNGSAPVRVNLEQLYELFPNLLLAPKPPAQDIPVPNGGKGSSRGTAAAPSSSAAAWTQPTLIEAAPLRPEPPTGAPPLYTFHTPTEPMPTTPAPSSTPALQDSQLIALIHTLCGKLHGDVWSVRFHVKSGSWCASAEAHTAAFIGYTGIAKEAGTPHEAFVNLLREVRGELDSRRKMLDELERELPKEVF
jgi:transcriptional regulator with XRE-family HTH domain